MLRAGCGSFGDALILAMNLNSIPRRWAGAYFNGDFIEVYTQSGYGMFVADPLFEGIVLPPSATNIQLGEALISTLSNSRFLTTPEARGDLLVSARCIAAEAQWAAKLMQRFFYKTKVALYGKLHICNAQEMDNLVTFTPFVHDKTMSWIGTKESEAKKIIVPSNSTVEEELGAALRAGFKACSGRGSEVLEKL